MLDYTLVEKELNENAPECYKIAKSNFEEERPIDQEILDCYRKLKFDHPNGFPVTQNALLQYWKPLLDKEFPKEAAFLHLSTLDAFTFYMGCAFVKTYTTAENKLSSRNLTLACNLKNYLALKIAITQPNAIINMNDIKTITQLSLGFVNDMKKYYNNTLSGKIYFVFTSFKYHCQIPQPLPVDVALVKDDIARIEEAQHNWLTNPTYEGIRKFDLQLASTLPSITGFVKNFYHTIGASLQQAQQNDQTIGNGNTDPTAPGLGM